MNIKVDFDNIVVKEDKNDFNVKVLMLKGEKGDAGDGEPNVIEKVQVNGSDLPVTNKTVNVPVPIVDSTLSSSSTNPVQNKAIYNALSDKVDNSELNNYYEISEVDELLKEKPYYFDNVAEMKENDLQEGAYVITKGYYNVNDGGGAEYIVKSSSSGYYETLNNSLCAELSTNDKYNVKKFGAKGDGETDDAPFIRNAIKLIENRGGGTLYFPKGTYYLNSGDPEGLSTSGIWSKTDYFSCFALVKDLNVIGDGEDTILLYNSNRIGYQISNSKGSVGTIFSNFRSRNTDNYAVLGELNFSNFKVVYTDLESGEKNNRDYIDGQLIRAGSPDLQQNYNGKFNINNISIENATGHQLINICGSKKVTCTNVDIKNVGTATNTANTDFSAYYINAKICNIENCSVVCDDASEGTAYEIHSSNTNLINCFAENVSTFTNVVGNILNYDSNYFISNNIARNVIHFVNAWIYENRKINNITISNNDVLLRYDNQINAETIIQMNNDSGGITTNIKPIECIDLYNNKIETNIVDDTLVDNRTYSNYLITTHNVKKIHIQNNIFNNFRRGLIKITEDTNGRLEEIIINNNDIKNFALLIPSTTDISGIYILLPPVYANNDVRKNIEIKNNYINSLLRSGSTTGIYFNARHNIEDTNTKLFIDNNNVFVNGDEIHLYAKSSTGTMPNSILLNHNYKNPLTNILQALNCKDCALGNFYVNSKITGSLNNYAVQCLYIGNERYRTNGYSNAVPSTGGYHQKGSIILNENPTFTSSNPYCWICTTAGNPGTWTAYNP